MNNLLSAPNLIKLTSQYCSPVAGGAALSAAWLVAASLRYNKVENLWRVSRRPSAPTFPWRYFN